MLIILTSEREIENETMLLNQLFENGLEVLHLRKPSFDIEGYRKLLNQIEKKYYKRIVIHQYLNLCMEYELKGIHLQESVRESLVNTLESFTNAYKKRGFSVSSSFHEPEELNACSIKFDYHLLSPVFSSISKQGYEGRGFDVNHIDKTIIGMGGVNSQTIPEVFKLGFKGIGVLGGVWNTGTPIESFKEIKRHYEEETTK